MPTAIDDVWPPARAPSRWAAITTSFVGQLAIVFLAYFIAGKLGQATTNIRSSNLGPVWPAYGIALAAFLAYGYRGGPAVALQRVSGRLRRAGSGRSARRGKRGRPSRRRHRHVSPSDPSFRS